MDAKLWFGKVHIMEWLPAGEQRTGRELYDEIEPMALVSTPSCAKTRAALCGITIVELEHAAEPLTALDWA